MKKSLKIFLACFLGGGIGTLTALQINGYFWWLGLLVGGLVGYISYEFKTVTRTIPKAWNAVTGWRPNKKWWREFGSTILPAASMSSTCAIGFIAFINFVMLASKEVSLMQSLKYSILIVPITIFVLVLISILFEMTEDKKERKKNLLFFKKCNPFRVYLWLIPKYTVLGLIWLIKGILHIAVRAPGFLWKVIIALARFIKTLFIMIHSEIRLLCGIDAMIGAVVGLLAGNVIIGAMAGGVIGVLNYEIISVRLLHLNASKIKNT